MPLFCRNYFILCAVPKRRKVLVAFKIDLEKAFDNVNWDFLHFCLRDFGFPDITIKLIMHCVFSSTFSILWNGNKMPHLSPLMVSDKVICLLLTCSSSTWRSYLLPLTMLFIMVNGSLTRSLTQGPVYLTSSLHMVSSCLPRLETLNFGLSNICLTISVRFLDWRSIFQSLEPFILQALPKKKLTISLLSLISDARHPWISIWVFLFSKVGLKKRFQFHHWENANQTCDLEE